MSGGGGSSSTATTKTQTQNLNLQGINGSGVAGNSGDTTIVSTDFGAISAAADIALGAGLSAQQIAADSLAASQQTSAAAISAAQQASADSIAASKQMAMESGITAERINGQSLDFGRYSVDAVRETSVNAFDFGANILDRSVTALADNQKQSIATVATAMRSDAAQSLNVMTKWGMGALAVVAIAMMYTRAKS